MIHSQKRHASATVYSACTASAPCFPISLQHMTSNNSTLSLADKRIESVLRHSYIAVKIDSLSTWWRNWNLKHCRPIRTKKMNGFT